VRCGVDVVNGITDYERVKNEQSEVVVRVICIPSVRYGLLFWISFLRKMVVLLLAVALAVGFSPSRAHTKDGQLKESLNGLSGCGATVRCGAFCLGGAWRSALIILLWYSKSSVVCPRIYDKIKAAKERKKERVGFLFPGGLSPFW
jgi:hypothetical protein